jgi:hypothetical protein
MDIEFWIPRSRPFSPTMNTLRAKFPSRDGDWFDQGVGYPKAPSGYDLASIRLAAPLFEALRTYLNHGINAGLLSQCCIHDENGRTVEKLTEQID